MNLLEAPAVFADAEERLTAFAEWLERGGDVSQLPQGIPEYQAGPGFIRDGFRRMIETQIAGHPQATPGFRALAGRLSSAAARQQT